MISGINIKGSNVYFDTKPVDELVKNFGSPIFAFSERQIISNYKALEEAFKKHYSNTVIYYSVKTNYELQILQTLRQIGAKVDIASGLELEIAKKAGFNGRDMVVDGPTWKDEEITNFIKDGVSVLNLDSLELMNRTNAIAKKLGKKVKVSFRIFPEKKVSVLKSFAESYISKFGIPYSQAISAYSRLQKMSHLVPVEISSHIGSMHTDPSYYEHSISRLVQLAADLRDKLGIQIEGINIGGGFGVPGLKYFSLENIVLSKIGVSEQKRAATIQEFGLKITEKFKERLKKHNLPEIKLVLEPGRYIVSDAGVLLTRVVSVKDNWIFIDGGVNILPESIFFVRRDFIVANKAGQKATHTYSVAGPTLSTGDVLATNHKMPKIESGDIVIVLDAGAYSLSRANQFTAMRPAALYIKTDQKIKFLRKKEISNDLIIKLLA